MEINKLCKELILHYVPAHIGIEGNELADAWAKCAVKQFTDETQAEINISLALLLQITKFYTWLKEVTSYSTNPPANRISATVEELKLWAKEGGNIPEWNPRKHQRLVILEKSFPKIRGAN
eukprot:1523999-Ditylum_brightwellii.AAC.1